MLGSFVHLGTLASGASYTRTVLVTAPAELVGTLYVFVRTDVPIPPESGELGVIYTGPNGRVYEEDNEDNNVSVANPLNVAAALADLVVTAAALPTTLVAGAALEAQWTVRNSGTRTTNAEFWYDDIFLSSDDLIGNDDDVYLGSRLHTNALGAGAEYSEGGSFVVPLAVVAGNYRVFIRTDRPRPLDDLDSNDNRVAEILETYNTFVSDIVTVTAPPLPDLAVTSVLAPSAAFSGREIEITWTVTNNGTANAAGSWRDVLFLSLDQIFDASSDQAIAYRPVSTSLAAGDDDAVDEIFGDDGQVWLFLDNAEDLAPDFEADELAVSLL